jgi:cytochrome c oxidase subunit II
VFALLGCALALTGCSSSATSVLRPSGPRARTIEWLWWLMLWISVVVFLVVLGFMVVAIARRRRPGGGSDEPRWGSPFIAIAGVVVPAIVLGATSVVSLRELVLMNEQTPVMTIRVIGHMWWWEAQYPNGAVTANEIHMPTGEPVRFELSTADVIHSFWVPQLAQKQDMVPGLHNSLTLEADAPGRYRGQCAEFCGLQHAHMAFFVVAQPPAEFTAWMQQEAANAPPPTTAETRAGESIFVNGSCGSCHTIRGTAADGTVGPDLTHVASRDTIAAGTLQNTPDNLARWVTAPQSIKPGVVMPPTQLSSVELRSLIAYLETLR